MDLLNITRWPSVIVFLLAGAAAACFAFVTVNLFTQARANFEFIREFGVEAIRHGALIQLAQLLALGSLALACWFLFKVCENVLQTRYMAWAESSKEKKRGTTRARD